MYVHPSTFGQKCLPLPDIILLVVCWRSSTIVVVTVLLLVVAKSASAGGDLFKGRHFGDVVLL